MLYEKYQRSMKRISTIIKGIKRFRYGIIAGITAVIILVGVGMFIFSGQISDSGYCPSTVAYGDELSYTASASFSSVTYEYAKKDSSNWSTEKPVATGQYKVRAIAYSIIGEKRCGKAYDFEIVPRQITITTASKSWTYDGKVHSETAPESVDNLTDGQVLVASKFATVKTVSEGDVENIVEYRIFNADQVDVTDYYEINHIYGTISVDAREIIVETASGKWDYDGMEHYNTNNRVFALVSGHEVVVTTYTKITQKGKVNNEQTILVKDASGVDCSENYDIKYKYGTLTIK